MNHRDTIKAQAWIGDAVLGLYARVHVLREHGQVDGTLATLLTSNQFLSACGNPDNIEAEIGRAYENQGLEAAFQLIDLKLMPMFARQQDKRRRKRGSRFDD